MRWNLMRLIGQGSSGDMDQQIGVSPFGEEWGENGYVRIAKESITSKEDPNTVVAFMMLLEKELIRGEYVKQIEYTTEMIDKYNANLDEIIDEKGYLKINEKVRQNNDSDSGDSYDGGELDGGESVKGDENGGENGFKRRSEDEV